MDLGSLFINLQTEISKLFNSPNINYFLITNIQNFSKRNPIYYCLKIFKDHLDLIKKTPTNNYKLNISLTDNLETQEELLKYEEAEQIIQNILADLAVNKALLFTSNANKEEATTTQSNMETIEQKDASNNYLENFNKSFLKVQEVDLNTLIKAVS